MSQRAAIRRRRQWANNFRHLAKIGRPRYPREVTVEKARQRLFKLVEKQKVMQQRKKKRAG